jgi:predicted dehydrogenase
MKRIRVAVIGVGHMGRFHVEKVSLLAAGGLAVELVAVADRDAERAAQVAKRAGARHMADFRDLLSEVDAVIVAVPTRGHFEVVGAALEAGCDVLVEKPIAASLDEARALLSLAQERERVLQVGHLEWYNAAMRAIRGMALRPRFIEAHRLGPFVERAADVDVVRDLMIHDLDIVQRLVGEEPERVEAVGVPVISEEVDIANARIAFPGGCIANVTASRVSTQTMRKLRFFQADSYFSIDFLGQSAVVMRRCAPAEGGSPRIEKEELKIDRGDALEAQLSAFFEAVRTRETPRGSGEDALRALRTALRVVEAMPHPDELR